MKSDEFIRKIKTYSILSFLLPLITINLCLIIFKMLGSIDVYQNYIWDEKIQTNYVSYHTNPNYNAFTDLEDVQSLTFTNCPKYKISTRYKKFDGVILLKKREGLDYQDHKKYIEKIIIEPTDLLNYRCIKNHKIPYFLFKNFNILEKYFLTAKKETKSGFSVIKNPYLYGEISISRSARYFPANLIFKPLIILSAIFLLFYWINNLKLFNEFLTRKIIGQFSKKFFYFGVLSSIFLFLHAIFLGIDFGSEYFTKIRRIIIVLFIIFEVTAQYFLTKNLIKFRDNLKSNISSIILNIKICFVFLVLLITIVAFGFLVWGDVSSSVKHILEWNYFTFLLIYYFLSRLIWKL
jgi:hypothetical protein